VVETIFLDWALATGAGVLFGIAGRDQARDGSLLRSRAFRVGLVYLHVAVIAVSATLYAFEPAWMWMYVVDPARIPLPLVVLAFLGYEACYLAGFVVAAWLERWRRNSGWALAGALFAGITAAEAAARVRLFHMGSYEEFAAGRAPLGIDLSPFRLEPAMALVLGPGALAVLALVVLLLRLRGPSTSEPAGAAGLGRPREYTPR
jgi:hypothetical protein